MNSPSTWSASIILLMYCRVANSIQLLTSSSNKTSTNIPANSKTNLRRCLGTHKSATLSTKATTMKCSRGQTMCTNPQCRTLPKITIITWLINKSSSQIKCRCTIIATNQTTWTTANTDSTMSTLALTKVNSNINHMNPKLSIIIFIRAMQMAAPSIMEPRRMLSMLKVVTASSHCRTSRFRLSHRNSIGLETSSYIGLLLSSMIALPFKSNGRVTKMPRMAKVNCLVAKRSSTTMATTSSGVPRIKATMNIRIMEAWALAWSTCGLSSSSGLNK